MTIINSYMPGLPVQGAVPGAALMAVLTTGAVDDYAVYEGIVLVHHAREDNAAWVAAHGRKCSYERAITYFPSLPRELYRD